MKTKLNNTFHDTIKKTFRSFDKDGNGFISKQELKSAMKKLDKNITNEEVEAMLIEADTNRDGKIDFDGNFTCVFILVIIFLT